MILVAIVVAEVAFWVLLLAGLLTRYVLRAPRIGAALLIATPVVDLALLVLTYVDLSTGKSSNFAHGLSAIYIGYSITLGPTIIRTLDKRFARRFGESDPKGSDPDTNPYDEAVSNWKRACMGSLISVILLCAGILVTGLQGAFWLIYWVFVAVFIVVLWWFIGPYREKKKTKKGSRGTANSASPKDSTDSKEVGSGQTTEERRSIELPK